MKTTSTLMSHRHLIGLAVKTTSTLMSHRHLIGLAVKTTSTQMSHCHCDVIVNCKSTTSQLQTFCVHVCTCHLECIIRCILTKINWSRPLCKRRLVSRPNGRGWFRPSLGARQYFGPEVYHLIYVRVVPCICTWERHLLTLKDLRI